MDLDHNTLLDSTLAVCSNKKAEGIPNGHKLKWKRNYKQTDKIKKEEGNEVNKILYVKYKFHFLFYLPLFFFYYN